MSSALSVMIDLNNLYNKVFKQKETLDYKATKEELEDLEKEVGKLNKKINAILFRPKKIGGI
ncbi:MAG: hypothetical protein R6V40_04815 [Candidatus Moraniibacteriota bacterium]